MTRLFIRFYVGVLVVLFLAWYIHGRVSAQRSSADMARVVTTAHAGGVRLVADELNAATSPEQRKQVLEKLRERFDYRVTVVPVGEIPQEVVQQCKSPSDVAYHVNSVYALLTDQSVVRMGPFPSYRGAEIEAALAGWMRLAKQRIDASPQSRESILQEIQGQFDLPVVIRRSVELPANVQRQIQQPGDVEFFSFGDDQYYSAIQLASGTDALQFGPFPSFENIEQKAATTTLGLVLLPAALAIALLLRPVARQLRHVENAAKTIAAGDLSARVDERRVRSAKPLALAFNNMAARTETLVRTQRELLQAVSHELRTPLARMRFAIDLVESAKDDDERKQRLDAIDAATEELDELVGELLSYVRMETTERIVHHEQINVVESLEALLPKFSSLYSQVEFRPAVETSSCTVFADRHGFQRAIGNLLSNAGRHAKAEVSVQTVTTNGETIIDIDDDGVGIPLDDRERIFEPFVRLEEGAAGSNGRGVGLGLALVQRIVHRNGGTIEVLESPHGGCRMRTRWKSSSSAEATD